MSPMAHARFVREDGGGVWTGERRSASDDDLVAAARRGDPGAFTLLFHRYKVDVWHLAWFTLRDHHDAEDVLQETFLKAHRALEQHRPGPLRPWLLAICRNACRDRLRSAQRRETLPLDEELAAQPCEAPDRERRLDFRRALLALCPDDREAFLLVDVLGLHSADAARIAGVGAPSTLRSRVARARRALVPAVAEPPEHAPAHDVWGLLRCADHNVIVVASSGTPRPAPGTIGRGTDAGLLGFLDALDRRIPVSRSVLAVVETRPAERAAVAAPWLARHPRWRVQRAPTYASWLGDVEELLSGWRTAAIGEREAVRARLASSSPFTWTCAA
jgi:RNA polymerase sigma-70 factor (ECF subfamily)